MLQLGIEPGSVPEGQKWAVLSFAEPSCTTRRSFPGNKSSTPNSGSPWQAALGRSPAQHPHTSNPEHSGILIEPLQAPQELRDSVENLYCCTQQQQDTSLRDVKRELQATAEEQFKLALQRHGAMQSLIAGTVV